MFHQVNSGNDSGKLTINCGDSRLLLKVCAWQTACCMKPSGNSTVSLAWLYCADYVPSITSATLQLELFNLSYTQYFHVPSLHCGVSVKLTLIWVELKTDEWALDLYRCCEWLMVTCQLKYPHISLCFEWYFFC